MQQRGSMTSMRRTVDLDPELEALLRAEAMHRNTSVEELLREAVRSYLAPTPRRPPPGAGAFDSGFSDTAERAEEILEETGFGRGTH